MFPTQKERGPPQAPTFSLRKRPAAGAENVLFRNFWGGLNSGGQQVSGVPQILSLDFGGRKISGRQKVLGLLTHRIPRFFGGTA